MVKPDSSKPHASSSIFGKETVTNNKLYSSNFTFTNTGSGGVVVVLLYTAAVVHAVLIVVVAGGGDILSLLNRGCRLSGGSGGFGGGGDHRDGGSSDQREAGGIGANDGGVVDDLVGGVGQDLPLNRHLKYDVTTIDLQFVHCYKSIGGFRCM